MSQATIIFGVILASFLIYITIKGRLPLYLQTVGLSN